MGKEKRTADKRAFSGQAFILKVLGKKNTSKEIPAYEPFLYVKNSLSTARKCSLSLIPTPSGSE